MLVFFSSTSENTSRFIEKLDVPALRIPIKLSEAAELVVDEDFVLVVPTYGTMRGDSVPKQVIKFLNLEQNRVRCKGVIGTGNRNFYDEYCLAADILSAKLHVPVLYRLELAGTDEDVIKTQQGLSKFWQK